MADQGKRKLQIACGNYLDFDQLARMLNSLSTLDTNNITFSDLEEDTGLPFRQLRNRTAVARAMGLFEERSLKFTAFGKLIVEHDIFFENIGTLEYCHYLGAGRGRNLVWFDVFDDLLPDHTSSDYLGWVEFFKNKYRSEYTEHSLRDHFGKEVRFIIDAYTKQAFRKLELIVEASDGKLQQHRYPFPQPMLFCAMIYGFAKGKGLLQMDELTNASGSPGKLFAMDELTVRENLEELHSKGLVRMEARHGLDQVRLKGGFKPDDFLTAYYRNEDPKPSVGGSGAEQGVLL